MNKNELQKYIDALENLGFYSNGTPEEDGTLEIQFITDHNGQETAYLNIDTSETLIDDLYELYDVFDLNEYVTLWLDAKRHGKPGVPDAADLVHDGQQIEQTYLEAWRAAIRVRDGLECPEEESLKTKEYKYTIDAQIFLEDEIEAGSYEEAQELAIKKLINDIIANGTQPFMSIDVLFED